MNDKLQYTSTYQFTLVRWRKLMRGLRLSNNDVTYYKLLQLYLNRPYHNAHHISKCLNLLDKTDSVDDRALLELAIWFHDASYRVLSKKNEERSAQMAVSFLAKQSVHPDSIAKVYDLIMVTDHKTTAVTLDQHVIKDIDLAILGSEPREYEAYRAAVRKEYWFIPGFLYNKARLNILKHFLTKRNIFTSQIQTTLPKAETQARYNLTKEALELMP